MLSPTSYREIQQFLSQHENLKIAILDNTNLGFFVQNKVFFRPLDVFLVYDAILIPKWVLVEMWGDYEREQYLQLMIDTLPAPIWVVDELEYVQLMSYQDQRLYLYFMAACVMHGGLRSFLKNEFERNVQEADLPENWLSRFYEEAFARVSGGNPNAKKKNAGEISILVVTHLLLHMFPQQIESVTWFSTDTDLLRMKEECQRFLVDKHLWQPMIYPISFKSQDVCLREAFQDGRIGLRDIAVMRHQPRRMIYLLPNADATYQYHEEIVDTSFFIDYIVQNPNCQIVF